MHETEVSTHSSMTSFVITAVPLGYVVRHNLSMTHSDGVGCIMKVAVVCIQAGVTHSNNNTSTIDAGIKEGPGLLYITLHHPICIGSMRGALPTLLRVLLTGLLLR